MIDTHVASASQMSAGKPVVEIRGLKTLFPLDEGTVRAVDGAEFTIRQGQTLGVVGESGCGKSVTAQSILRIVPPPGRIVEGEILYYRYRRDPVGHHEEVEIIDLARLDPRGSSIRSIRGNEIAMVFQEPMIAFSPVHTLGNQIMESIILHQGVSKTEAREKALDMLARVGMPRPSQVIDSYPFELSGGMRQRGMIAMALSCHPRLLIADEPTTALDVTTEAQILDLLRDLQDELGMAIMYITHNLGVVAEMASEAVVMYLGKVVEWADVYQIFGEPLHPYTQALLRSIPRITESRKEWLEVIQGIVPDPYHLPTGCPFHPRCTSAQRDCAEREPPWVEVAPGHRVRCLLYEGNRTRASSEG